jgi:hypothetical protein
MACTSYPEVVLTSRPTRAGRCVVAAGAATFFAGGYGWFVLSEASRPSHGGSLAAYVVGFGLALVAAVGAWAAAARRAWGLSLAALAAQGSLLLLGAAALLALTDALFGAGAHEPLVAVASLGVLQAAVVILGARPDVVRSGW